MNRIDRLTAILLYLQGGKRSASQIAQRFEISRRTAQRDVQALSEMGIPIIAEAGTTGGYSLPPDFTLPPLALTFHEALLLRLALNGISQLGDSLFKQARESLLTKVQTLLPRQQKPAIEQLQEVVALQPPVRSYPTPFLDQLLESVQNRQWLRVVYRSENKLSEQTILPFKLRNNEGLWYCEAYSRQRQENRVYRVDRFQAVSPEFHSPSPEDDLTTPSLPNGDPALPEMQLYLTTKGALMLERDPNLGPLIQKESDGTWIKVHVRPQEYPWIVRIILGLGTEVTVIAPPELQKLLQNEIEAITRHHFQ